MPARAQVSPAPPRPIRAQACSAGACWQPPWERCRIEAEGTMHNSRKLEPGPKPFVSRRPGLPCQLM